MNMGMYVCQGRLTVPLLPLLPLAGPVHRHRHRRGRHRHACVGRRPGCPCRRCLPRRAAHTRCAHAAACPHCDPPLHSPTRSRGRHQPAVLAAVRGDAAGRHLHAFCLPLVRIRGGGRQHPRRQHHARHLHQVGCQPWGRLVRLAGPGWLGACWMVLLAMASSPVALDRPRAPTYAPPPPPTTHHPPRACTSGTW